jgi:hypothetical protein
MENLDQGIRHSAKFQTLSLQNTNDTHYSKVNRLEFASWWH